MTKPLQPNLINLPMAPAQCVVDNITTTLVDDYIINVILSNRLTENTVIIDFITEYRSWIISTKLNNLTGLDTFPIAAYSNGTTEAFDKFYLKHATRKFRCFRGEYLYHTLLWNRCFPNWEFLDDVGKIVISQNDAVVISLPFADTGNKHHLFTQDLLDLCYKNDVPILLDCAFFGICGGVDFDFSHPAITDVCFSLSKSFPVSNLRIGIRFTRANDDDSLTVYNTVGYLNTLGAAVGHKLLKIQSPDTIFEKYRQQQLKWCQQLNLVPSSSVIFGLDKNNHYIKYNRGMIDNNRICFSKYFNLKKLPNEI